MGHRIEKGAGAIGDPPLFLFLVGRQAPAATAGSAGCTALI